jgi:hypothetical protein
MDNSMPSGQAYLELSPLPGEFVDDIARRLCAGTRVLYERDPALSETTVKFTGPVIEVELAARRLAAESPERGDIIIDPVPVPGDAGSLDAYFGGTGFKLAPDEIGTGACLAFAAACNMGIAASDVIEPDDAMPQDDLRKQPLEVQNYWLQIAEAARCTGDLIRVLDGFVPSLGNGAASEDWIRAQLGTTTEA